MDRDMFCFHIKGKCLDAVLEIAVERNGNKMIGQTVLLHLREDGKLIYQITHVICLGGDRAEIFFLFLRCVCNTVQYSLTVSLDGGERGLQVVCHIAHHVPGILLIPDTVFDHFF